MARERLAIDAWGSYIPPEGAARWPDEFLHIFEKYKSPKVIIEGMSMEYMLDEMDRAGVDMVVLSAFYLKDATVISNEDVAGFVQKHPDRFVGSGSLNILQKPMDLARQVEHLVKNLGMKMIRMEPFLYGDGMTGLPPNAKHYWPVYIKCVELGVPVGLQVGHTGPLLPSECCRPIYLDEVALAFPELVIQGCHLGQPWHEEMMILAWKHPNVYVETSARTPRLWPASFVEFAKSWGQNKVLWGTDYPVLTYEGTLSELEDLNLGDKIFRKVVRDNCLRVLGMENSQGQEKPI